MAFRPHQEKDMDVPSNGSVGPVYIGAGTHDWETWFDGSLTPHSSSLVGF